MKKLERLTSAQEAQLAIKREEWIRIGRSVAGPVDRVAARTAIEACYRLAGKEPPKIFVFLRGPWDAANALALDWSKIGEKEFGQGVSDIKKKWHWPNFYGGQDAWYWRGLSWFDAFREFGVAEAEGMTPWIEAAKLVGWCWLYWNVAIITDRPTKLKVDDRGRLHCEDGPALEYADGLQCHVWHGTRVPPKWITSKSEVKAQEVLQHDNVEVRRAGCEILGWANMLRELNAKVIDQDADPEIGTLLSVDLPGAPNSRFIKVQCGTKRTFALPVPARCKTALEANAWSYDLDMDLLLKRQVRT